MDTDGDGVSDWAEKVTGFDPTNANTHGAAQDDHTALTADLAQENVVTVTAAKRDRDPARQRRHRRDRHRLDHDHARRHAALSARSPFR